MHAPHRRLVGLVAAQILHNKVVSQWGTMPASRRTWVRQVCVCVCVLLLCSSLCARFFLSIDLRARVHVLLRWCCRSHTCCWARRRTAPRRWQTQPLRLACRCCARRRRCGRRWFRRRNARRCWGRCSTCTATARPPTAWRCSGIWWWFWTRSCRRRPAPPPWRRGCGNSRSRCLPRWRRGCRRRRRRRRATRPQRVRWLCSVCWSGCLRRWRWRTAVALRWRCLSCGGGPCEPCVPRPCPATHRRHKTWASSSPLWRCGAKCCRCPCPPTVRRSTCWRPRTCC